MASMTSNYSLDLELDLNLDNIVDVYDYFKKQSSANEIETCLSYLDKNAAELVASDAFLDLPFNLLCDLLPRDTFYANEIDIFNAVIDWHRSHFDFDIKGLLRHIRWCHISPIDYSSSIRPLKVISDDEYFKWNLTARLQRFDSDFENGSNVDPITVEKRNSTAHHFNDERVKQINPIVVKSKTAEISSNAVSAAKPSIVIKTEPMDDSYQNGSFERPTSSEESLRSPEMNENDDSDGRKRRKCVWYTEFSADKYEMVVKGGRTLYSCKLCKNKSTFQSRSHVLRHIITIHNKEKLFGCDVCGNRFLRPEQLAKHRCGASPLSSPVVDIKPLIVKQSSTNSAPSLTNHTTSAGFLQRSAPYVTRSQRVVNPPLRMRNENEYPSTPTSSFKSVPIVSTPIIKQEPKMEPLSFDDFPCMTPVNSSKIDSDLVLEESGPHSDSSVNGKKRQTFWLTESTVNKFKRVIMDGATLCVCKVCDKTFANRNEVLRHITTMHNKEKRFSCGLCFRKFTQRQNVYIHIETVHKNTRKYRCYTCGNAYKTKSYLDRHEREVHQRFNRQTPTPRRQIVPSGDEFAANYNYPFIKNEPLTEDSTVAVKEECSSVILCGKCGDLFTNQNSFKLHKLQVHGRETNGENFTRLSENRVKIAAAPVQMRNREIVKSNPIILKPNSIQQNQQLMTDGIEIRKPCFWLTKKTANKCEVVEKNGRKVAVCKICQKEFRKRSNALQHIATVHCKEKLFSCHLCGGRFTQRATLNYHIDNVHAEGRQFACNICGRAYKSKTTLVLHQRRIHNKSNLNSINLLPSDEIADDEDLNNLGNSNTHIEAANLEGDEFYQDFSDYQNNISHNSKLLNASKAEPWIVPEVKLENDDCDEVIDVFSQSSRSQHNGNGVNGVHQVNSIQMHNGFHSSDEHLNGLLEPEIELNEEEPYAQQHSFEDDSDYQEMHRMRERFQQLLNSGHLSIFPATVEPQINCVAEEKEETWEDESCSQVDSSVDSFSNYKVTRILKDGCWQFVCTECNESFPNRNAAYKHRSMVHEMDNPFQCFLCGKENNSKQRLLNHIDCDHQSESEQFCDICGRYFGDNELMLKHRREEHEKHYVCHCSICDKGFKSKNALEYHNNHLHLKAFRCDVCDAWFTRQTTLKQHIAKKHSKV